MKANIKRVMTSVSNAIKKAANPEAYAANQLKQKEAEMLKNLPATNYTRLTEEDVRRQMGMKKGGYIKKADGCAKRGKTKGRMV
jgi:hypothetical protein